MMLCYGVGWTFNLLVAPFLVLGVVFIELGVGVCWWRRSTSPTRLPLRDPVMIQFWFLTPVVYPANLVPAEWRWLLFLNPMAGFIEGFRCAFLGKPFDWMAIAPSLTVAVAVFALVVAYFEKVERRFADII